MLPRRLRPLRFFLAPLLLAACLELPAPVRAPEPVATPTTDSRLSAASPTPAPGVLPGTGGRGFPVAGPWLSFYGNAAALGDLGKAAATFRILNLDADPGQANFTKDQIAQLRAGGRNRVLSYLNVGACEHWRAYWRVVPSGFVAPLRNTLAQLGDYESYPDETWMDVGNPDYQHLIVDYVAPRLVDMGVDGLYLDNLELVEHPEVLASTRQGGLDLVAKLRDRYPGLLLVMQNATGPVTRMGMTRGVPFPSLLDGIAHEQVYRPFDSDAESELIAWQSLLLKPGGRPFWIATEDYVGTPTDETTARAIYDRSRGQGFSPWVTDASSGQQVIRYWSFLTATPSATGSPSP